VPIAIKDNIPVAGEPMRSGSLATPEDPQPADHPVVARLRAAGAVVVGLTNLPELGIYPFSDSAYGVARNPWAPGRTAGGSSGGRGDPGRGRAPGDAGRPGVSPVAGGVGDHRLAGAAGRGGRRVRPGPAGAADPAARPGRLAGGPAAAGAGGRSGPLPGGGRP